MIKKILLRIAYIINKHYKIIEIKHEDIIKYMNNYFIITNTSLIRDISYGDSLNLEARDILTYSEINKKYNI